MTDALEQANHFEPLHSAHSIEQVVFVITFDGAINDNAFISLRKALEPFKQELPAYGELGISQIMMHQQPVLLPAVGAFLRLIAPNGTIQKELRVERNSLMYMTTQYSHWDSIWNEAEKYLNVLIPEFISQVKINAIGLNYLDKYLWDGEASQCSPNLLLRPLSKYICPHVYETNDFWHSHTGAFIKVDETTRRLININIDYIDENRAEGTKRLVAVTTVLNHQFNQDGYEPYVIEVNSITKFINEHMRRLHEVSKEVLENIIDENMCKRIALIEQT